MLNLDYLKSVAGGDEGFMKEMMNIFKSEIPKSLTIIQQRLDETDLQGLRDSIHKYKASLLTLGMNDAIEQVKKIEEECKGSQNIELIKNSWQQVLAESQNTLIDINSWLAERA